VLFLDIARVVALLVVFALNIVVDVDRRLVDATSVFVFLCVILSVNLPLCFVGLGRFVVCPEYPVKYVVCGWNSVK
jgi:hypothetical protein